MSLGFCKAVYTGHNGTLMTVIDICHVYTAIMKLRMHECGLYVLLYIIFV